MESYPGVLLVPVPVLPVASAATSCTRRRRGPPSTPIMPGGAPGTPSSKVKEKVMVRNKVVVALYPFKAIEGGDLSLDKGAEYEVLDDSQEHWWKVKDENGAIGYIPSNYVKEKELLGLQKYEWYVGDMSRQRAESCLKQEDKEGCFVVRNSSTKGLYTLSLYTKVPHPHVKHYHIKQNSRGEFFLSEKHCCGSIPDLVNYHRHNSGGLASRLKASPCDRPVPATAGLSHVVKLQLQIVKLQALHIGLKFIREQKSLGRSLGDSPQPAPRADSPPWQWPLWPPHAQAHAHAVKHPLRPAQSHAQTSSTDLLQLVESGSSKASAATQASTSSAATTTTTPSTAKSRSLQFAFPCTRATKSPSPKLEKARSAETPPSQPPSLPLPAPKSAPASASAGALEPPLPSVGDRDVSPVRARCSTLSRHSKAARGMKHSPLATNTLPNPKTRRRSTTHPDPHSPRAGSPPLTLQQVAEYLARVTSQGASQTRPSGPTPTRSKHRSRSPKSFSALTPSSVSVSALPPAPAGPAPGPPGLGSLLSSAALSYSAGYLQDYSPAAPAPLASYSPPPEYSEYSPTLPCPSEYQEPVIDPPPLPPPNFQRSGGLGGGLDLEPEPDSDSPELEFLDASIEDFEDSPPAPALFADYLDFTSTSTSTLSRGKSSRSSHLSASPRTPDSGLHAVDYSPEPMEHVSEHGLGHDLGLLRLRQHSLPAPVPIHAPRSPSLALPLSLAHGRDMSHGMHMAGPGSSLDACGLCATLGQPWVDICRAIRASKTK
ncbi:Tyrosine-protein kinase Btk29A [Frankliniella fusca]|uniref:Tyrosine-protein kinase Btk29A n=1 Tax=Frankliniella fusca TaxID=407009 RepID=A0AAE1HZ85_9NEOP|nr:Tyrosine-protein kinase Btk29A [Frankliniella fusca]